MKKTFVILLIGCLIMCICCLLCLLVTKFSASNNTASCPDTYVPVCGENGVSYDNDCKARVAGTKTKVFGKCANDTSTTPHNVPDSKICGEIFNPVCGEDGVSYANSCIAGLYHTQVHKNGFCDATVTLPTVKTQQFDLWDGIWKFLSGLFTSSKK